MQVESLRYHRGGAPPPAHGGAAVPAGTRLVFLGRSLPEHDEEIAVVHTHNDQHQPHHPHRQQAEEERDQRVVWQSGLSLTRAEEEAEAASADPSSSSTASASGVCGGWGVRLLKSFHFPSALRRTPEASSQSDPSLAGMSSVEAMIRGGAGDGGPVLQVVWATFANFRAAAEAAATPEPKLCVLQAECLHVLSADGEQTSVQLPCLAKAVWVLLEGVLIERQPEPAELVVKEADPLLMGEGEFEEVSHQGEVVKPPTFFSLLHPLEELKPVSKVDHVVCWPDDDDQEEHDAAGAVEGGEDTLTEETWMTDATEQVVWTCEKQPFVLTYSTTKRVHSFWLIRQSRREVVNRMRLEGSADWRVESTVGQTEEEVAVESRRASMTWQPPHSHQLTPTHPSHAHPDPAKKQQPKAKDFYQQFLLSSLGDPAGPAPYHPASSSGGPNHPHHDDAAIHTELLLERSWTQEERVSCSASSVFLTSDLAGHPLLCMFTASTCTLRAFRLTSTLHPTLAQPVPRVHLTPSFTLAGTVRSVVPVYLPWRHAHEENANPYEYAMAVLGVEGGLVVMVGEDQLTEVEVKYGSRTIVAASFSSLASPDDGDGDDDGARASAHAAIPSGVNVQRGAASRVQSLLTSAGTPARTSSSATATAGAGAIDQSFTSSAFFSAPATPADVGEISFAAAASTAQRKQKSHRATALFGANYEDDDADAAAAVDFDQIRSSMDVGGRPAAAGSRVVRLSDAVSNRLTLELSTGECFRVGLPTRFVSPVVHAAMGALACALTPHLLHTLRADMLHLRASEGQRRTAATNATTQPTEKDEWSAFVALMRHLLGCTPPSPPAAAASAAVVSSSSSLAALTGDDAWKALLASASGASSRMPQAADSLMGSAKSALDLSTMALRTTPAAFLAELPAAFHCLHLTYEELKIPTVVSFSSPSASSSSSSLHSIGGGGGARASVATVLATEVLVLMAIVQGRREYLDAYTRELASTAGVVGCEGDLAKDLQMWATAAERFSKEAATIVPNQPPSIYKFLMERLRASSAAGAGATKRPTNEIYSLPVVPSTAPPSSSSSSAAGVSTGHTFLLSSSLDEPFAWSRKLLLFYDLLTRRHNDDDDDDDDADGDGDGGEGHFMSIRVGDAAPAAGPGGILPGLSAAMTTTAAAAAARRRSSTPKAQLSEFIHSPYALPSIEAKQIERSMAIATAAAATAAAAARHSANQSQVSSAAPTPSGAPKQQHPLFTPSASPRLPPHPVGSAHTLSLLSPGLPPHPSGHGAHPSMLLLSPLLGSPFPTPMSPFTLGSGGGRSAGVAAAQRVRQQRRVAAMQIHAAVSSRVNSGLSVVHHHHLAPTPQQTSPMQLDSPATATVEPDSADYLRTPGNLRGHPGAAAARGGRRNRVSFGANTTVGTVHTQGSRGTLGSVASARVAAVAASYPVFAPSSVAHSVPLFLSHTSAESVVLAMVSEGFTLGHLAMLPFGLALPLLECLKTVREHPPVSLASASTHAPFATTTPIAPWPRAAYLLIGREDLGKMFSSSSSSSSSLSSSSSIGFPQHGHSQVGHPAEDASAGVSEKDRQLDEELEIAAGRPSDVGLEGGDRGNGQPSTKHASSHDQPDLDGTLLVQRDAALRFGQDLRLKEVRHLLRSDRVLCVSLDAAVRQSIDAGEAEASVENQTRLAIIARRALCLPVARGMYTLASLTPVLSESLPIPPLLLRGRLPPLNSLVDLDFSLGNASGVKEDLKRWPEFHNGVAAALRVLPAVAKGEPMKERMQSPSAGAAAAENGASDPSREAAASSSSSFASVNHASLSQITRTWIVYNRPTAPSSGASGSGASAGAPAPGVKGGLSHAHAGFLFGLGLTGHLACLTNGDFFWYLSQNHEPTAVAMLLGMAACKRGTMDTVVSKMLTLHVPALLPANFSEMNIPSLVQSSALLGIGMVYLASCHRLMAEVLLNEIGRRPDRNKADESFLLERENYSLSAGLGLGLLLLGKGADAQAMSGLADLHVEKKLSLYIHGGKDTSTKPGHSSGGGASGGGPGGPGQGQEDDYGADGGGAGGSVGWMSDVGPRRTTHGGGSSTQAHAASGRSGAISAKNGRIREGALVNVDVTSPGATLALGLMYLQSNNSLMAARVSIPTTHFQLDYVRSDFIFLRVLARHLILWDAIPTSIEQLLLATPTGGEGEAEGRMRLYQENVLSLRYYMPKEAPPAPSASSHSRGGKKKKRSADTRMNDSDEEEESKMDNADDCAGEAEEEEQDVASADDFTTPMSLPSAACSGTSSGDIDYATLRQGYLYIVAANCFALGLKHAGTCDQRILRTLLRILAGLRAVAKRRGAGGDFVQLTMMAGLAPAAQLHKVDRGTLEAALVAVATSVSLLMCGSGNLQVFQHLRALYKTRPDRSTPAGWYTSISMCIGLLFLGGGRYTLDTSRGASGPTGVPAHAGTGGGQANIAFLVIAFYPHMAHGVEEQRYYLQIYRHLYVLATTQRGLQTIDVDTGLPCYVPLEVIVEQGRAKASTKQHQQQPPQAPQLKRLRFITPCLLPPYETIHRISIVSARFHALSLQLRSSDDPKKSAAASHSPGSSSALHRIYVKRKLGFDFYENDPKGLRSIQSRTFPTGQGDMVKEALGKEDDEEDPTAGGRGGASVGGNARVDFLKSFSTDPRLMSFTQMFLRVDSSSSSSSSSGGIGATLNDYISTVLYECLQEEKFFEVIQIYLQLFPLAHDAPPSSSSSSHGSHQSAAASAAYWRKMELELANVQLVQNLVMLRQYYQSARRQSHLADNAPSSRAPAHLRPVNHSAPFHTLPLAEGSAGVELADAESFTPSTAVTARLTRPLLSTAFLDAILTRVEEMFARHAQLQHAFDEHIRRAAHSSPQPSTTAASATHPLLGSLLTFWSIPDSVSLHSGLGALRQCAASTGAAGVAATRLPLVMVGLLWPHLPATAVHAILRAVA